ncbi:NAD(P)/FAD-dependent oxidoreductase [Streptomyces goshikiensis]|uniref:NAD(P)/FAD-dependent oxidoreductase n=1 Tax=Streptomyces goshikiensis TaxID=1942 RepID=UPI00365AFEF5
MPQSSDVVILGAGGSGIYLASDLARRNIPCTLIDQSPAARYASTRNQGWLQSGAFYIGQKKPVTAAACREGYKRVIDTYPCTVHNKIPAYALFRTNAQLTSFWQGCEEAGITLTDLSTPQVEALQKGSPFLRHTEFEAIIRTIDHPVNTHRLLQLVLKQAAQNGAHFCAVPDLGSVYCSPGPEGWDVILTQDVIRCRVLVLACGAFIPAKMRQLGQTLLPEWPLIKVTVLVMRCPDQLSTAAFMVPLDSRAPTVIPFCNTHQHHAGVTVVCSATPIKKLDVGTTLPDGLTRMHADKLEEAYPDLRQFVRSNDVSVHFYTCQIPFDTDPQIIYNEAESLIAVYPGKFTASPVVAEECGTLIASALASKAPSGNTSPGATVPIAKRLYFEPSTHKLVLRDELHFEQRLRK